MLRNLLATQALPLVLASLLGIQAFLHSSDAHAWQRPAKAQGHLIIYFHNEDDLSVDWMTKTMLWFQRTRLKELIYKTLPSKRVHLYTGKDYVSGKIERDLNAIATKDPHVPIDMMTLTHSHPSGRDIQTPQGYINLKDSLFKMIPESARPRLRLFMSSNCWGIKAAHDAFAAGFKIVVGSADFSLGPLLLDEFLLQWLQGKTAVQASARVNWSCRNSKLWKKIYLGTLQEDYGPNVVDYCNVADLIVLGAEGRTDSHKISIETPVLE